MKIPRAGEEQGDLQESITERPRGFWRRFLLTGLSCSCLLVFDRGLPVAAAV